jgi:hypothetical protein
MLRSLVDHYQHFRGICYLHLQAIRTKGEKKSVTAIGKGRTKLASEWTNRGKEKTVINTEALESAHLGFLFSPIHSALKRGSPVGHSFLTLFFPASFYLLSVPSLHYFAFSTAVCLERSPVLVHLLPSICTVFSMLYLLFYPEGEVSRFLQNFGNDLPNYMASHIRS